MITTTRRRATGAVVLLTTAALSLSACGGKQDRSSEGGAAADSCEATPGQMTIATGNSTGVYYALGGGLANVISQNTKIKATAAETGASVQNIQQLVAGQYDVAFSLADTAAAAVEGTGPFEGQKQDVKALSRIYSNYTQVIVLKSSGIKSIADMKGKRISTGSPKSGTVVISKRLFEVAGLKEGDVRAQRLDLGKSVDAMKDGSIDGLIWSGGLPTSGVTDLTTSIGDKVDFLDVSSSLPKLKEMSPVYEPATIPAATYKTSADVKSFLVPNLLLVKSDFADNDACALTRLLFEKKADLEKVHAAAKALDPAIAVKTEPVQLHPGSKKALDELAK